MIQRTPTLYIGVDPGKTGACAFIDHESMAFGEIIDTSDGVALAHLVRTQLHEGYRCVAGVEKVHSSPQMGVVSAFSFGRSFGTPFGVFAAFDIPCLLVSPAEWNKLAFKNRLRPKDPKERKEASRRIASERWPMARLDRKKDQAVAEALHIARVLQERGD